jgi:hypothetical protein
MENTLILLNSFPSPQVLGFAEFITLSARLLLTFHSQRVEEKSWSVWIRSDRGSTSRTVRKRTGLKKRKAL